MNLKKYYEEVALRIDKIDFSFLWPKFKKYNFALYDNERVIINNQEIKKTDGFLGNTSIKFNNDYIAIWNLSSDMDYDILTSKIIHEMFHAFQNENKESRFPSELDAVINYEYNKTNLQIKYKENLILKELLGDFNINLLEEFLKLRKFRKENFSYEYDYETKVETIEGSAEFVELLVLKQLNINKYHQQLGNLIKRIINPNHLIPIRIICYDIGVLILTVCEKNNISINKDLTNYLTFSNQLISNTSLNHIDMSFDEKLEKILIEDNKSLQKLIKETILKNNKIITGPYDLIAFNVYQARFLNGYLYSKHFIIYNNGTEDIILYGDYLVKLVNLKIDIIYQVN